MGPLKLVQHHRELHRHRCLPCPMGMAPLKRFGVCFESVSGDGFNDLTGSLTDECFVRRLVVF